MALIQGGERIFPLHPKARHNLGGPHCRPLILGWGLYPTHTPLATRVTATAGREAMAREQRVLLPHEPPTHPVRSGATLNTSISWVRG